MAEHEDNHRKRDFLKRGYDKVTSKLGHASHGDVVTSNLAPAMSTTFSSTLFIMPEVSLAHKTEHYPLPNPSQAAQDADETRFRGPADPRTYGSQNPAQFSNRLPGTGGNKEDDDKKKKKKVEDNKTGGKKDDSKKKGRN